MQLLTESRSKTYRRCAREEMLRYQLSFLAIGARHALLFGSLWHSGLEAWWGAPPFARIDQALAAMAHLAIEIGDDLDLFDLVHAEELLRGYDARWADQPFETLAVEQEFRAPLINPETGAASKTYISAGKIDAIARQIDDGREFIVEHKTSGEDISPGSSYWARLRFDSQISGYFTGATSLGYHPESCLYDVVGKTKLKPLKATPEESRRFTAKGRLDARQRTIDETPEEYGARVREDIAIKPDKYFQRATIVRLEDEMRTFDFERWQLAMTMREGKRLGIAPRNPDACSRFNSICSYFPVCAGEASIEDPALYQHLDWPHPELSQDFAAASEEDSHGK